MPRHWTSTIILTLALTQSVPAAWSQTGCSDDTLEERDKGWAAAAFEEDLDRLMDFYHDDGAQLPPGGPVVAGKQALRDWFAGFFADPDYSLTWAIEKARVAQSCDLGYTRGTWTIISRDTDGRLVKSTGKYLGVWVRNDVGRWVVLEDIFNNESLEVLP